MIGAAIAIMRSTYDGVRNGSGATIADAQSMTRRFMIFDPTIFPTAISDFPLLAATIEVVSSGALVPIATIVSPMIDSESQSIFARSTAPDTRSFPPTRSTDMPAIIQNHAFHGLTIFSTFSLASGTKLLCLTE